MRYLRFYFLLFLISSCFNRELRGRVKKSTDKQTYLVIKKEAKHNCKEIFVDGKLWKYNFDEKGLITPGTHQIGGCGEVQIEIKKGTIFYFDYWGP